MVMLVASGVSAQTCSHDECSGYSRFKCKRTCRTTCEWSGGCRAKPTVSPTASPTAPPTDHPTSSACRKEYEQCGGKNYIGNTNCCEGEDGENIVCTVQGTFYSQCKKVTKSPTTSPTSIPTKEPTKYPTDKPTSEPTLSPTAKPSKEPTKVPTTEPTKVPTTEPTSEPTTQPTIELTKRPTAPPVNEPTLDPTSEPTRSPTNNPTVSPTNKPSLSPSMVPTAAPKPIIGGFKLTGIEEDVLREPDTLEKLKDAIYASFGKKQGLTLEVLPSASFTFSLSPRGISDSIREKWENSPQTMLENILETFVISLGIDGDEIDAIVDRQNPSKQPPPSPSDGDSGSVVPAVVGGIGAVAAIVAAVLAYKRSSYKIRKKKEALSEYEQELQNLRKSTRGVPGPRARKRGSRLKALTTSIL